MILRQFHPYINNCTHQNKLKSYLNIKKYKYTYFLQFNNNIRKNYII